MRMHTIHTNNGLVGISAASFLKWPLFFMACLKPIGNRTKGFLGAKCVACKSSHRTLCVKGGSISLM